MEREEKSEVIKDDESDQKQKKFLIDLGGVILGFIDQVSDILVIFSNQFANQNLFWAALAIWIFNVIFVSLACFKRTIKAVYWRPTPEVKKESSPYIFTRVSDFILKLLGFIFNFIITILNFIIVNFLTLILVWFGFSKLFFVHKKIMNFLYAILFSGKDLKNHQKQQLPFTQIQSQSNPQILPKNHTNFDNNNITIQEFCDIIKIQNENNYDNNNQNTYKNNHKNQNNNDISEVSQLIQVPDNNNPKAHQDENLEKKEGIIIEEIQDLYKQIQEKMKSFKSMKRQENNVDNKNNEIENDQNKFTTLVEFHFKMEIAEKLFENLPQLILQIINQSMGGYQNQNLNILSIVFSFLNIFFNIFLIAKMSNKELQENYEKVLSKLKELMREFIKLMKSLIKSMYSYLTIFSSIHIIIYIVVAYSYEWNDYIIYKDTSYGKDADDSIRAYIIIFPIFFTLQFLSSAANKKYKYILMCLFNGIKNIFLITFIIDVLAFNSEHLQYGQQILGTIALSLLSFFSILDCILILIWNKNDVNVVLYALYLFLGNYFVKSFSWFINYAHYYDWTPYEDKTGECNEKLETIIKGVLILYLFRFITLFISFFTNMFNIINGNGTLFKFYDVSCFIFFIQLSIFILDCLLLQTQTQNSFCDDLQYAQRHYYIIIQNIVFGALILLASLSPLIQQFYFYRIL